MAAQGFETVVKGFHRGGKNLACLDWIKLNVRERVENSQWLEFSYRSRRKAMLLVIVLDCHHVLCCYDTVSPIMTGRSGISHLW